MGNKYFNKDLTGSFLRLKINAEEIKGLCNELRLDNRNQELIIELMQSLFTIDGKKSVDRRSILHPDKFDIYFDNVLNTKGLLFKEFLPVLDKNWMELKTQALAWLTEDKGSYLIDILKTADAFVSKDRFEKIVKLWITLINMGHDREPNLEFLVDLISNGKNRISDLYDGDDALKAFFRGLFKTSNDCYFYTTYILRVILRKYIDQVKGFYFPLNKIELQEISIARLKEFMDSRKEFDTRVFIFFYYNCWEGKTEQNNVVVMDEANKLVYSYVKKYPVDFLRWVIRPKFTPHIDNEYVFEPFIYQYFNGWDKFEAFLLETAKDDPEFTVLIDFYQRFKKSDYKQFYTEEIPPWIEIDSNTQNAVMKYFKHQTYEAYVREIEGNDSRSKTDKIILILSATYEWPAGQVDVTKQIREMISKDQDRQILVAPLTFGIPDPAEGIIKTLKIHCKINGKEKEFEGSDGESIKIE